jgi:Tfp pilus assembly protein PilV
MKRTSGFSIVEALIGVTVVVLIGLVGYNLYSMQQSRNASVNEQQSVANETPAAPEINDTADLDKAAATLDQINPEANDIETAELDSEAAF